MNKALLLIVALASASRMMLPHQNMSPPSHWTPKPVLELLQQNQWGTCDCDSQYLNDGYCDEECNTIQCAWEHGDCGFPFECDTCEFVRLYTCPQFWPDSNIFDDLWEIEPCCEIRISSIQFEVTEFITGIRTNYATLQDTYQFTHRGNTTENATTKLISFDDDEVIVSVSGHRGWNLDHIKIVTNKGNEHNVGNPDRGAEFEAPIPDSFHVVGFGGATREYIDGLYFYIKAHPDMGCECDDADLGTGVCNPECYTQECAWDLGDCTPPPDCPCELDLLLNGVCDPQCNVPQCWNDLDACPFPNCQCSVENLENGTCNWQAICNNSNCNYDNEDCPYPGCLCDPALIGDDVCNEDCNTVECLFDGSDCGSEVRCDLCRYTRVGPIGEQLEGDNTFDDLVEIDACCNLSVNQVTVYYENCGFAVAGLEVEYGYDYTETVVVGDFTEQDVSIAFHVNLVPDQEIIIKVEGVFVNGHMIYIGLITWSFTLQTTKSYYYGDSLLGEVEVLNLNQFYPVVAFYGSTHGTLNENENKVVFALSSLGVYARVNPDEGCRAEFDNALELLGNGVCNLEYFTEECLFDLGDCPACDQCSAQEIYNEECNEHCNTEECFYDNGSCEPLPPNCTCPRDLYLNNECDLICNFEECGYDNNNCEFPGCQCDPDTLRDGNCEAECDNLECFWDDGDCLVPISCDDCKYKLFEPVGIADDSNVEFNDLTALSVCCFSFIKTIHVTVLNGAIHGITTTYEVNGILEPPVSRIGTALGQTTEHTFQFTYDDYLVHISGNYNPYINFLQFTTLQGNVYTVGTPIGTEFSFDVHADESYEVVGFLGSVGDYIITLGCYYKIVDACQYSSCDESSARLNGECDYSDCYNEICGWDWGDCEYPGCNCDIELLFNDECDEQCNVEDCAYDNGACKIDGCTSCDNDEIANGVCNLSCNIASCQFDGGDCWEGCDCNPTIIDNDVCNFQCWYEACQWDGDDCEIPGCDCSPALLWNQVCDVQCNTEECQFDNGDCQYPGCPCQEGLIGNGTCNPNCNTAECIYDGGDCPFDGCQCTESQLQQCTPDCNVLACNFSNDHCGEGTCNNDCTYLAIGPVSSTSNCESTNFDDFDEIEACCDVALDSVSVYLNDSGYISAIGADYTLDYGTRTASTLNGSGGSQLSLNLSGNKIVKVSGQGDDTGIYYLSFDLSDGSTTEFGVANDQSDIIEYELNERYFVLGFFGSVCDGYVINIFFYIRTNPDEGGCQCDVSLLNDGTCNYPDCYTQECNWDGEDCKFPGCPEECTIDLLFNQYCDVEFCNHEECRDYDENTCIPDCDCEPFLIGDGICHHECNTEVCLYDGNDCPIDGCSCPAVLLGDGICQEVCDNIECHWDSNDCLTSFECEECGFYLLPIFGEHNQANAFDDSQLFPICCQVDIEIIGGQTSDSGCINSLGTVYSNDGINYTAREVNSSSPFHLQLTENVINIVAYVTDGVYTGLKFTTNFNREHLIGTETGESHEFQIEIEGAIYEAIAFVGSFNDEGCLTSFSAYYQITDSCNCEPAVFRENGECDWPSCYNKFCGWDWNECPEDCDCAFELLFNDVCNLECNTESCNYDNGSCPIDGCTICNEKLLNGECDLECNTAECEFDNASCIPECNCLPSVIGDLNCDFDAGCYTEACFFDGGDCNIDGCDCSVEQLWNGVCDPLCNTEECDFDNGSCRFPGCTACEDAIIGNDQCDLECNIESCAYDDGDCEPYPGCQCDFDLIANDTCNSDCNELDCEFDGEDCPENPPDNVCPNSCKYFKTGLVGGNAIGSPFDLLNLGNEFCCNANMRAIYIGYTDDTYQRINEIKVFIEKDYWTKLDVFGYKDADSLETQSYNFNNRSEFEAFLPTIVPSEGFILNPDEFFGKLTGSSINGIISEIVLYTNENRTYAVGESTPESRLFKIDLRNNWALVNFFGKRDVQGLGIAKVGMWVRRVTNFPSCQDYEQIGDGNCDYFTHYNELCLYDGGDCEPPSGCDCSSDQLYNGECDWTCNYEACLYDNGECEPQGCLCSPEELADDICQLHCNTVPCGYDPACHTEGCTDCGAALLDNEQCDQECNTVNCNFDNFDCTEAFECDDCRFVFLSSCEDGTREVDHTVGIPICCQLEPILVGGHLSSGLVAGYGAVYHNDGVNLGFQGLGDITENNALFGEPLEPGDFFTTIDIETNESGQIVYIRFNTFLGKHCAFGAEGTGTPFTLSANTHLHTYKIVALAGAADGTCPGAYFQITDVCECGTEEKFNNVCDPECYNQVCGNDWDDCSDCICSQEELLNDICDPHCNTSDCAFDNDSCTIEGCTLCGDALINNGVCDLQCNYPECNNDNGDCLPDCFCDHSLLGNGECNLECNTEACNFDNGECYAGCDCWAELKDGCCTPECNTSACYWDNGECTISFSCNECEYVNLDNVGDADLFPDAQYFDDLEGLQPCCNWFITYLTIYGDVGLVGIEPHYLQSDMVVAQQHYTDVSSAFSQELILEDGDYISKVKIGVSNIIDYLYIETHSGQVIVLGDDGGNVTELDIPEGYEVSGFKGAFGDEGLYELGVYLNLVEDRNVVPPFLPG